MDLIKKIKHTLGRTNNNIKKDIFFKHFHKLVTKEALQNPQHTQNLLQNIQQRVIEIREIQDEKIQYMEIMELEKQEQETYTYIFGENRELAMSLLKFTEGNNYGYPSKHRQ